MNSAFSPSPAQCLVHPSEKEVIVERARGNVALHLTPDLKVELVHDLELSITGDRYKQYTFVFDKEWRRNEFATLICEGLGQSPPEFPPAKGEDDDVSSSLESSSDMRASLLFGTYNLRESLAVVEEDVLEWDPLEALLPPEVPKITIGPAIVADLQDFAKICVESVELAEFKEKSKLVSKSWLKYSKDNSVSPEMENAYHEFEDSVKAAAGNTKNVGAVREKLDVLIKLLGGSGVASAQSGESREEMKDRMRKSLMVSTKRGHANKAVVIFPIQSLWKGDVVGVLSEKGEHVTVMSETGATLIVPRTYLQMLPPDLTVEDNNRVSSRKPMQPVPVADKDGADLCDACIEVVNLSQSDMNERTSAMSSLYNEARLIPRVGDFDKPLHEMMHHIDQLNEEYLSKEKSVSAPSVAEKLKVVLKLSTAVMGGKNHKFFEDDLVELDNAAGAYAFGKPCPNAEKLVQLQGQIGELLAWARTATGVNNFSDIEDSVNFLLPVIGSKDKELVLGMVNSMAVLTAKVDAARKIGEKESYADELSLAQLQNTAFALESVCFTMYTSLEKAVHLAEGGFDPALDKNPGPEMSLKQSRKMMQKVEKKAVTFAEPEPAVPEKAEPVDGSSSSFSYKLAELERLVANLVSATRNGGYEKEWDVLSDFVKTEFSSNFEMDFCRAQIAKLVTKKGSANQVEYLASSLVGLARDEHNHALEAEELVPVEVATDDSRPPPPSESPASAGLGPPPPYSSAPPPSYDQAMARRLRFVYTNNWYAEGEGAGSNNNNNNAPSHQGRPPIVPVFDPYTFTTNRFFENAIEVGDFTPGNYFPDKFYNPPVVNAYEPYELLEYKVGPDCQNTLIHGLVTENKIDASKSYIEILDSSDPKKERSVGKSKKVNPSAPYVCEWKFPIKSFPCVVHFQPRRMKGLVGVVEGEPTKMIINSPSNVEVREASVPIKFHSTPTNIFPTVLAHGEATILPKLRIALPRTRYFPGETVRGCVVLNIRGNATQLQNFSISAKGAHNTQSWYRYQCGSHTCIRIVHEECVFFKKVAILDKGHMVLQPGQYCFEFAIRLSTNLPSSSNLNFDMVGSCISYSISAQLKETGKKLKTVQTNFAIIGQPPPMELDLLPTTGRLVFKMSRKKDPVLVSLQLTSGAPVTAGGFVPFHVNVNNNTKKKIQRVEAFLYVELQASAQGYLKMSRKRTNEQDLKMEIIPKGSADGNYRMKIPENFNFYNYHMPNKCGRATIRVQLCVKVSYGVASLTISRDIQLVPDMKHLADVPPPLYYLQVQDTVLDAEYIVDNPPWYFYV